MTTQSPFRIAGWVVYQGGELVRCPYRGCGCGLGVFGPSVRVSIRIHPGGRGAKPTTETGFSHGCHRCKTQVEFAFPDGVAALPVGDMKSA